MIYTYGHIYFVHVKQIWLRGTPRDLFTIPPPALNSPYTPMPPQPCVIFGVDVLTLKK